MLPPNIVAKLPKSRFHLAGLVVGLTTANGQSGRNVEGGRSRRYLLEQLNVESASQSKGVN